MGENLFKDWKFSVELGVEYGGYDTWSTVKITTPKGDIIYLLGIELPEGGVDYSVTTFNPLSEYAQRTGRGETTDATRRPRLQ